MISIKVLEIPICPAAISHLSVSDMPQSNYADRAQDAESPDSAEREKKIPHRSASSVRRRSGRSR
jgi:hypothetical protein